jgi:hypothetical protein
MNKTSIIVTNVGVEYLKERITIATVEQLRRGTIVVGGE